MRAKWGPESCVASASSQLCSTCCTCSTSTFITGRCWSLEGGGDNWLKLELSFALLPRGAHCIYKHILFYWYPTFFALKNPPRPKNWFFILIFSHSRSILEQNVWTETLHNRGVVWGGVCFLTFCPEMQRTGYRVSEKWIMPWNGLKIGISK